MKKRSMKKQLAACFCMIAAGAVLLAGNAPAETAQTDTGKAPAKIEKAVKDSTREQEKEKRAGIIKEAISALAHTQKAIEALGKKDKQAALDALAMVTGKLDIIIAREPELTNAPISVRVETFDLIGSVETIKDAVKKAKDLLDEGEVQEARSILAGMMSEIDVVVTSVPLASYSDGIKAVARLVDEEKYEEATNALYDLLSTLVITRNIIPLPVVRAEELLKKAEKLAETQKRTDEQNKELESLLNDTRKQIEIAETLGYGDKKEYKTFYRQIKEIRKKTEGGKFGKGFMDSLKNSLKEFKAKVFGAKEADHTK